MPSPRVSEFVKQAPPGIAQGWTKDTLAAAIAGLLVLWRALYPKESLAKAVKEAWKH